MKIKVFSPGLQYYVDRLKNGDPFTFIRYGDGEWSAILGDRPVTSSGSQRLLLPGLHKWMKLSIKRCPNAANYIVAMRATSLQPAIRRWLDNNAPAHIRWHDCTVFYKASKKGRLYPFVNAVRNLGVPIAVIGPERLRRLDGKVFEIEHFIEIPGRNAFVKHNKIIADALKIPTPAFITISAGPAGKVIAHKLYNETGGRHFTFDLGSLWDPYVGKRTRMYHKGMLRRPAVIKANLEGG